MRISAIKRVSILFLGILTSCSPAPTTVFDGVEEGSFLVHRRQSPIGEENYTIHTQNDTIVIKSVQGENERGRISGILAELRLSKDLEPILYSNKRISGTDTITLFRMERSAVGEVSLWEGDHEVSVTRPPKLSFPLHSNIPAAMEMALYHYCFKNGLLKVPTLPRGEVSITHSAKDTVILKGKKIILDRYIIRGINWGGRTVWLDESNNLVALVMANTQIREIVRKGYEGAMETFVQGNVEEQMKALEEYTRDLDSNGSGLKALVGGDLVTGLNERVEKDMTLIVEAGLIKAMGPRKVINIPEHAQIIDLTGKFLIPGLWDMHAHSNQVQWAPAYLAGGVTTIRDNGNELEFATAFRDAIALEGKLGPEILLAGMTDGPGIKGNGIIRATSPEQARKVVALYHKNGYKQIKIYTSIEPEILKVLSEEAHKLGLTVTGHIPSGVGSAKEAIEGGMDQLSHRGRFLSILFPDKTLSELPQFYLTEHEISKERLQAAIQFYLEHGTVLDPTIALDVVRALPKGVPIESVEPDAGRMAYELYESKRYRRGLPLKRAQRAKEDYIKAMEVIGEFHRAGIPIVAGTDNIVPVFSLYLELETYHRHGGFSTLEALKSATIVPAKVMGMDHRTGTLEVGKEADIAILEENPLEDISNIRTVTAVMTNGKYYDSQPLWEAADFKPKRFE